VLVVRRSHPEKALTVAGTIAGVHGTMHFASVGPAMATVFALYSVAAYADRRTARVALGITLIVLAGVAFSYRQIASPIDIAANYALFVVPWVLGENFRNRRELVAQLEERAERAEREREADATSAVETERARIARELHDVVAHTMGVMVVQAGAARRVVRRSPDQAEDALCAIESTGRTAMTEMRRLVGVLRRSDDGEALDPQPSLERLDDLVDSWRDAGLPVELAVSGTRRPLPAGIELSAYRIVQEALTNARRHAAADHVRVGIVYEGDTVDVRVADDGRGASAALRQTNGGRRSPGEGQGLIGMRERVDLYGGTLRAGPRPGGGFEVHARLPIPAVPR
jgi:signal transduction histidine kinase